MPVDRISSSWTGRSRLGGLTRSAMYDGQAVTSRARSTFEASFSNGHGCAVCPRIDIPAELPPAERERRAIVLRKLHYTRIANLPRRRRKAADDAA
ncbi:MAG: hypothetical protein M3O78_02185 [Chloroflexota bacterium]|nr:hypothetical protein [Chloroflexota bacterium]